MSTHHLSSFIFVFSIAVWIVSTTIGCGAISGEALDGGSEQRPADSNGKKTTNPSNKSEENTVSAQLSRAHALPAILINESDTLKKLAAQIVFEASTRASTNSLTTTGTLTETNNDFIYNATPTDRLVFVLSTGAKLEFRITTMNGDFSSDADTFIDESHQFEYEVSLPGKEGMRYRTFHDNGATTNSASGKMTIENTEYQIDIVSKGTHFFEIDSSGSETENKHHITGTVTATNYSLALNEQWYFSLTTNKDDSATVVVRTINSALTIADSDYRWNNVEIAKSYRRGLPSQIDTFWRAKGAITNNGEPYGEYQMRPQIVDTKRGGFLIFELVLPNETIEIERNNAHTAR